MTETNIFNTLISQAPGTAAVIIVVILFLKSIEKRDTIFISSINKITDRLTSLENLLLEHKTETRSGMEEMRRITRARKLRNRV